MRNFLLYLYTHEVAVKVVAIAVRMVITTLRILPQSVLLLNVPIFVRLKIKDYRVQITELFALLIKLKQSEYRVKIG